MIKIAATAITVLSGTAFGVSLCREEKEKIKNQEETMDFVLYISRCIENFSLPLPLIFEKYQKENPTSYVTSKIKGQRGSYGEKIMYLSENIFSDALRDEIKNFTQSLGCIDKESQIKLAQNAYHAMEKELSDSRKEYTSKSRLYQTVSMVTSCIIAVLLY